MSQTFCLRKAFHGFAATLTLLAVASGAARAASEHFSPPATALVGLERQVHLDAAPHIHLAIELQPKDPGLDALAATIVDPASPIHRSYLTKAQFDQRYGRSPGEVQTLVNWLRGNGAENVYASSNRLVVGGDFTLDQAAKALGVEFALFLRGDSRVIAPTSPLTLPVSGIRAVRGSISAFTPRLADTPSLPNDFRGEWFTPERFREAYDAADAGGNGARIVLIEDSSNQFQMADLAPFLSGAGAPPGANESRVTQRIVAQAPEDAFCGRDDRGQEATLDIDTALTMAPTAIIDVRYDQVCVRGGEGTLALQRVLDDPVLPNVIVFPFTVGPTYGVSTDEWGPISIPYLEAAVRGIPIVVPAGDDGAYGVHEPGRDAVGFAYPCVLSVVICAGGTQLGTRSNVLDEGPWNDGVHASGGGISHDPRPSWQLAPERFEFSPAYASNRVIPDVSADASGHLRVFWHDYGIGGVGGTSESAAIVGAQIATINAAVPAAHKIAGPGDLYKLATAAQNAFRDIAGDNDRGYVDNTLHPKAPPVPIGFKGVMPSPPPTIIGCTKVQPRGCAAVQGFDGVSGIGSLKERAAIDALQKTP